MPFFRNPVSSTDNALAEAFNSIFRAELVRNKGPWRGISDLEIAVTEYIDWYTTTADYTVSSV